MKKEISNKIRFLAYVFTVGIVLYHLKWHGNLNIVYANAIDSALTRHFFYFAEKLGFVCLGFFFFFSAFWFYRGGLSWSELMKKWKKRIKTLLVPYLCWTAVVFVYEYFTKGNPLDDHGLAYWLFLHPMVGPLWYILGLLILQFMAPVFLVFKNKKVNTLVFIALALWAILRNFGVVPHVFNPSNWWWYNNMIFYMPIYLFGAYVGMYYNGLILKKNYDGKRPLIVGAAVLLVSILLWSKLYNTFIILYIVPTLVGIWLLLKPKWFRREMPEFLKSDFYIYALHQPILIPLVDEVVIDLVGTSAVPGFVVVLLKLAEVAVVVLVCCTIRWLVRKMLPKRVDLALTGGR